MNYMLRVVIFEDRWEKQLADIVQLCKRAKIEEVLLMEQSHQIMMVPFPLEKHRSMAEIYCKIAEKLRKENIIYSINLASLVGHAGAVAGNNYRLPYQQFVGENLKEAPSNYCILDECWQEYAADVCATYAVSKPDKMYIDDDFRSLNHTTPYGCFCPIHVKKTSERFECGTASKAHLCRK